MAAAACCAALYCGFLLPAQAGPVADQATLAETLLDRGYGAAALSAFDKAAAAFWEASPLQLRTVLFADKVEGYADYTPRGNSVFRNSDTLRIYFEPVGFAFRPEAGGFTSALAADLQIRTPGGLILATSEDFGRLQWQGRSKMHEVHATIEFPLPDFKPGEYQLLLTLRDEGSPKTTTVTLPFSVAE
ncbi:MAG: hypothetical protein KDJ86_18500 [Bauldia sp.]|uniref:hypothetical protein n=1 Tax=Bauldia sp. TaxID=2575872 RepID=UPI001D48F13F|nr:hypothetical protein [Bauldia sp.]MCB1497779.1 hypothetical protein [Bauldia sp.]